LIRYDATQAAFYREKLIKRIAADTRECYQCGNCSASCPAAFTFDLTPNQMMRMLQVGLVDKVLDSKAIQLCIQCLTCTARCPRNIDIAGIFEDLRTIATAQEREVPEYAKTFNKAFMGSLARFGRLPELYMMGMFYLGTMKPKMAMGDVGLAMPMLTKRKMQFLPRKAKGADEVARIVRKTMDRAKERERAEARVVEAAAKEAKAAAERAAEVETATAAGALGATDAAGAAPGSEVAE
jgi:heterodisulfide reductase subunit C